MENKEGWSKGDTQFKDMNRVKKKAAGASNLDNSWIWTSERKTKNRGEIKGLSRKGKAF